jgi:hypothetical protein
MAVKGIRYDPFADVDEAQRRTREGVIANAELMRPELMSQIGDTLGGLNSIGALRSGGTKVALDDINRQFTDRIGLISRAATQDALGTGLGAGQLRLGERRQQFEESEARRKRRASLLGSIGSVVGAGIGFLVGGPPGAAVGGTVGGKVVPGSSDSQFDFGS